MSQNQRPTNMSANHTNPNLGMYVLSILRTLNFKTIGLTTLALFFGVVLFGQRIVFPGQDLLVPHLTDPAYVGIENRFNVTGMLQIANSERRQHSQFLYAQIPFTNKLSFGADYFKDAIEFYSYSTAMVSARVTFDLGGDYSRLRLGISAGIDSRRQTGFPAQEIPNMEQYVPILNEGDTGFTYRAGINYDYNALSIGGTYNKLPIQTTLARTNQEDLIGFWIKDGFTAHIRYNFYLTETLRLTPFFRYLSYANDPIYEGAVIVNVGDKVSASISYKNDYSINPAVRYEFLDVFQVGYSYEKAIGDVNFDDVHSLSMTYKFKSDGSEESDWQQNAKANNRKIAAIKPKKPKEEKPDEVVPEVEKEAADKEAAQKEATEKEATENEAAQKEAAQRAAEREAAQKVATDKEAARKEVTEKEVAQKEAAEKVAAQRAAEREAAQKEATDKETAQKEVAEKEAAQKEAAEKEAAEKEATQKEVAEKEAAQKEATEKEAIEREAAEKEAVEKEAVQKEAAEKAAAEMEIAQKEAAQKAAAEREAAQKEAASEREAAEKEAAQKAASEREAAEKELAEKEAAQKEAADKEAAQKAMAERVAAEKVQAQKEAAEIEAVQKENAEKEAAQKAAAEREAAEKELAEKEAAQKEAADKEAVQKAMAERMAAEKVQAQKEAAEIEAVQKENAEKEAAQKEAAERESAAQKAATEKEQAQKVAAEREAAQQVAAEKEAAERKAEQKVEQKEGEPVKENPTADIVPVELDPILPRFAKDGSEMKAGYYVIVGTYDTMAKAQAEKERLSKLEYYTAIGLKTGDATFYLYVDYDDVNDDAKKRQRAHNLDPNFRKAYLLEVD